MYLMKIFHYTHIGSFLKKQCLLLVIILLRRPLEHFFHSMLKNLNFFHHFVFGHLQNDVGADLSCSSLYYNLDFVICARTSDEVLKTKWRYHHFPAIVNIC